VARSERIRYIASSYLPISTSIFSKVPNIRLHVTQHATLLENVKTLTHTYMWFWRTMTKNASRLAELHW
jgi:hypothetical protein